MSTQLGIAHAQLTTGLQNIVDTQLNKTFTMGQDPSEDLSATEFTSAGKNFVVCGGVNHSSTDLSKLNPVKVSDSGALSVSLEGSSDKAKLQAYTNVSDENSAVNLKALANRLEVMVVGSNDTAGGTPHRHLTIDGNGRIHTIARIEQSPTINAKLDNIIAKATNVYTTQVVAGNTFWSTEIDTTGFSKVEVGFSSSSATPVFFYGSETSGGTKIPIESVMPTSSLSVGTADMLNTGKFTSNSVSKYLYLGNPEAGSFTMDLIITKSN